MIQNKDVLESFDVLSVFTVFPVSEVIKFVRNEFHNDRILQERTVLRVKGVKEELEICLSSTYLHVDG